MSGSTLITGSAGFLGGALCRHLGPHRELIAIPGRSDFARRLQSIPTTTHVETIIHAGFTVDFSASTQRISESVENTQTLSAFSRGRGVEHFVFLSAAGALGVSAGARARSEDDLGTTDPGFERYRDCQYIQDKLRCSAELTADPPAAVVTTLFPTTVYGRGMRGEALGALAGLRGPNPIAICPPGGTSFLGLEDLLTLVDRVLEARPRGGFVVSSGNVGYGALYRAAGRAFEVSWRKVVVPLPRSANQLAMALATRTGVPAAIVESSFGYKYYTPSRARAVLGWTPRSDLAAALRSATYGL